MTHIHEEISAVAFHLCNLLDELRISRDNKLGCDRVAQAILDVTEGKVAPIEILDLVDQERTCRDVERSEKRQVGRHARH